MNTNTEIANLIPMQTLHQLENLIDIKNFILIPGLYDSERASRHQNAIQQLHQMYYTGAFLLNSGYAYSSLPQLTEAEINSMLKNGFSQLSDAQNQKRLMLLKLYSKIPPVVSQSGLAVNPLHAVFLLKVTLDHIRPQSIYETYCKLASDSIQMTHGPNVNKKIIFANGSQFTSELAAESIMKMYIQHNPEKFTFLDSANLSFLTRPFNKVNDSYNVFGTYSTGHEDQIMSLDIREVLLKPDFQFIKPDLSNTQYMSPELIPLTEEEEQQISKMYDDYYGETSAFQY